jgi:flagellar biogenesis protein FliO
MARFARTVLAVAVILAASMHHAPASAQQLAQGDGVEISVWRVIVSLLFCIALAAGAIFALRRKLPHNSLFKRTDAQRLKLVEQISLGPQRGVYLIDLDGEEYLALLTQQGVSLTALGTAPKPPAEDEA